MIIIIIIIIIIITNLLSSLSSSLVFKIIWISCNNRFDGLDNLYGLFSKLEEKFELQRTGVFAYLGPVFSYMISLLWDPEVWISDPNGIFTKLFIYFLILVSNLYHSTKGICQNKGNIIYQDNATSKN